LAFILAAFSGVSNAAVPTYYNESYNFDTTTYGTFAAPHSQATIYIQNNEGPSEFRGAPDFIRRSVLFTDSPAPSVLAKVSAYRTGGGGTYISGGHMSYDISVSGPASTWVPVSFDGIYSFAGHDLGALTNSSSGSAARVAFSLVDNAPGAGSYSSFDYTCSQRICHSSLLSSANSSSSVSETALSNDYREGFFHGVTQVLTNSAGVGSSRVFLDASAASILSGSTDVNTVYSFIDPEFHIESAWLLQNPGASLTLPSGIGNAISSVPEQQAWLLLLVGFPVLLFRRHTRRIAA